MDIVKPERASHRERYQGKNLLLLLLALAVPTGLLYLRIVLAIVPTQSSLTAQQAGKFVAASDVALGLFFIAQLIAAGYVMRLLPTASNKLMRALRYLGVLLLCGFFSLTGAMMLEGFGYYFFLRFMSAKR